MRIATLLLSAMLTLLCVTGQASAWLKYRNDTPNTISTVHAFASISGFLCGYSDSCPGGESGDFAPGWRVHGWWNIAPGGTATVSSQTYHNAYHQGYAQDAFGHVWSGGGKRFCAHSTSAFNWCGGTCNTNALRPSFFVINNIRCCGEICSGSVNHTLRFTL